MINIVFKILLVAVTFAFLLSWGYIKQQRKNEELLNNLYKKIENKVMNEFKKKEKLTIKDIENLIKGTKASLFWSKNKITVTDPRIFIKNLIKDMLSKGLIIEVVDNNSRVYKAR
ncbi:hypothetical protein [Tepidibacter hydrothermalis]|uniref:Uncharacterized protein n=1 Tax=Tepidibacter hydrothermalis TaxID=3036126 RepID=A0ABY8EDF7_9FIRM|nr:hypothetical protein [Tepidibacter hydrothermalis]WFD10974.1 hypothetical protein P4S50_02555 [Tepidibacter hydrothermalis]